MNLRDLQYLVSVAKHKHFGKAAKECFVSQPSLSMQIKKLEDTLGVQLFERTNKNVMVTEVGKQLIDKAKDILQGADDMVDIANNFHDPLSGEIRIGAFPTLAPYFLPRIIPKITKKFPKLKLLLLEEKTDVLIDKLKSGEIDTAFLALPIDDNSLECIELFEDEFLLAVSTSHKLADKNSVTRNDLKNDSLLLLDEGHCLRAQALEVCSLIGLSEQQDFRATSLETLRQMVVANVGITLIPKLAKRNNDSLVYIPFEKDPPTRKIAMFWRRTSSKIRCCKSISEEIKQIS